MEPASQTIALLLLSGIITPEEADLLQQELPGKIVGRPWQKFISQIEMILRRPLYAQKCTKHNDIP